MSIQEIDYPGPHAEKLPEGRQANRTVADLRTIVQYRGDAGESWKEVTQVTTISKNGAGFTIARPVGVGRLLKLVMPLPDELRAYDLGEEVYPVIGLVQYCNPVVVGHETKHHVGVGFVGKVLPQSYKDNPGQNYRITGMSADGLWTVTEASAPHKPRKNSRFWIPVPLTLSMMKRKMADGAAAGKEDVFTHNISIGGASVPCSLEVQKGDRIKVANKELDFYAIASVKNRKEAKDGPATLNLEFVEAEFPINKVLFAVQPEND